MIFLSIEPCAFDDLQGLRDDTPLDARIGALMTRETKNCLLEGAFEGFECLGEFETVFVYLLLPLLCLVAVYILSAVFYQFIVDTHVATAPAASDVLSINPDKWFPRV